MYVHKFAVDLGGILVETLQSVSGLTYGQDVVEVKQVSSDGEPIIRKQPGTAQSGQITITRGMDRSEALTNWVKETQANHNHAGALQNISVVFLDSSNNVVKRIQLLNAWASSWSAPDLAADGSGPAMETVQIEFDDMVME
jgi:phage tail-like protein